MNETGTRYYSTTTYIDLETGEVIRRNYIKHYKIVKTKIEHHYNNNKTICHVKRTKLCRHEQQLELFGDTT